MDTRKHPPPTCKQRKTSDIQQRRERGRAAQAAFRQRQIDRINDQEAQIQSFMDAMETVKRACMTCKAGLKVSIAIGNGHLPARIANQVIEQLEIAVEQASSSSISRAEQHGADGESATGVAPEKQSNMCSDMTLLNQGPNQSHMTSQITESCRSASEPKDLAESQSLIGTGSIQAVAFSGRADI